MDELKEEGLRKAWGRSPDSEVLKVLEKAELQSLTQQLDHTSICDNTLNGKSLIRVFFIYVMCPVTIILTVWSCLFLSLTGYSLNPIDSSNATIANQVPLTQACQPAIDHSKQEVTCQKTVPITTEVKSQELILPKPEEIQNIESGESETEGESTVLNMNV